MIIFFDEIFLSFFLARAAGRDDSLTIAATGAAAGGRRGENKSERRKTRREKHKEARLLRSLALASRSEGERTSFFLLTHREAVRQRRFRADGSGQECDLVSERTVQEGGSEVSGRDASGGSLSGAVVDLESFFF